MSRRRSISLRDVIPHDLPAMLVEGSRIGFGLDIATTDKAKSNPSALALTEQVGLDYIVRLLLRWKTSDPEVTMEILRTLFMLIAPRRARKLCIDATSERFFAARIKREFSGIVPVELLVSSEVTEYLGEKMSFKVYLGNLLINTLDDGRLWLPNEPWVRNDFRSVKRQRGSFVTEIDEEGNHGDGFDAVKNSLHALIGAGGAANAAAAQVGNYGTQSRPTHNPFSRFFKPKIQINV